MIKRFYPELSYRTGEAKINMKESDLGAYVLYEEYKGLLYAYESLAKIKLKKNKEELC